MAEQENFEDDLFADLYNDDEPAQPAPKFSAAPDQTAAAPPPVMDTAADAEPETHYHQDQNGGDTYMNNDEVDDDDDEVDFNLGNGTTTNHADTPSSYSAPAAQAALNKGPNSKEDGKMFIGGLNWETTDQSLRDYFSQFGEVIECTVMRDSTTGRSRGFGFLTFKDPKTVNIVMVKEHYLDGKIIDPKRAIPRDEQEKTSKIFVGGVSQDTTDHEFREYFAQFGRVVDATLMMDKDTGRPRGFGFVTFESEAGVDACLTTDLEIHGKPIEVKKAQPRGNVREEEEAARRGGGGGGKFGRKGPGSNSGAGSGMEDGAGAGNQGAMAGMAGAGGMTPQVMAQYWQRMQQYFAMMQQQMAMNRGMNMNPAMMQMMQMQQMQQMMAAQGRGGNQGGNPMANMNPQMMQQMQQMMNQSGAMNQDPQAAGVGSPQGDSGGNHGGYNAFEQQQYEQQKYDQQRRPNRDQQQQQQQAYGGGGQGQGQGAFGMGGGGGGGGVTSWEGMYDDVPQPMMHQGGPGSAGGRGGFRGNRGAHHQQQQGPMDPAKAPPANAPTGPKNAGKPGANYRGGGRGGNRGFHPYARG